MAFNGQCSIVMGNLVGWEKRAEKQGQGPQERKGEERMQWKQEPFQERGKGTAETPDVGRYGVAAAGFLLPLLYPPL